MTKPSDDDIRQEILMGLNHSRFEACSIDVEVEDGEVTLSGFVDSWESKRSATDVAENVSGVSKVEVQFELRPRERP